MIPIRYGPILFAFFLSLIMSFIISGVSTFMTAWGVPGFLSVWGRAWMSSWFVAFPCVFILAPIVRRIVASLVRAE